MGLEEIAAVIGGLGLPTILLQLIRSGKRLSPRDRLLQDIEIMKALHVNSDARRVIEEHVKNQALRLTGTDSKRRDPLGIVLASIFLVLGVSAAVVIWLAGGWWWFASPIAGFFLVFGAAGLAIDSPRKERDERGRAL